MTMSLGVLSLLFDEKAVPIKTERFFFVTLPFPLFRRSAFCSAVIIFSLVSIQLGIMLHSNLIFCCHLRGLLQRHSGHRHHQLGGKMSQSTYFPISSGFCLKGENEAAAENGFVIYMWQRATNAFRRNASTVFSDVAVHRNIENGISPARDINGSCGKKGHVRPRPLYNINLIPIPQLPHVPHSTQNGDDTDWKCLRGQNAEMERGAFAGAFGVRRWTRELYPRSSVQGGRKRATLIDGVRHYH